MAVMALISCLWIAVFLDCGVSGLPYNLQNLPTPIAPPAPPSNINGSGGTKTVNSGCGGCGAGAIPGTKVRTCERSVEGADCVTMKTCFHRRPNFMGGGTQSVLCPQVTKCNKTERYCCSDAFPVYAEPANPGMETELEKVDRHLDGPVACEIPEWTSWSKWSSCSKTCGGFGCGKRTRFRTCLNKDRVECSNSHHQVETEACGSSAPCDTIQRKPCPRYSAYWWGWWGRSGAQALCAVRVAECCSGYSKFGSMCQEIA